MSVEDKKTLLLVEDDFLIALGKQQELEKYGYEVINVNSGEKAVAMVSENHNINLILMDIDLGKGIDGTDAAALILKECDIPVVFMSSHTEPEIVEKTEKITSYGYVVKNSSITVLDASIKMAFKLFNSHIIIEEGKNLLQKTIDGVADPVLMIDKDYRVLSSNLAAKELYSRDKEYCYQISHNRDIPCKGTDHLCMLREVIENKILAKSIHKHITKNGEERSVELTATPIFNDENEVMSIIEISEDITDRLYLEEIKNEYTANLDSLINNHKESIWSIDSNYNYVILNDYFKKNYFAVYNIELKKGVNALNILPSKEIEFWKSKYDRVFSGEPVNFEHSSQIGIELHFFEVFLNPIITNKKVTGVTALSIDVTERIEKEEIMLRRDSLLTAFTDALPDISFIFDEEGKYIDILSVDDSFLYGKRQEIIGSNIDDILPKETAAEFHRVIKNTIESNSSQFYEYKLSLLSGEVWFQARTSPMKWEIDGKNTIVWLAQDITERRKSRQLLIESEKRYRDLYFNSPLGYQSLNSEGKYVEVNPALCDLLGYRKEELIGKKFTEVLEETTAREIPERFSNFVKTGKIDATPFDFVTKFGEVIPTEIDGRIAYDDIGNFKQTHCIIKDMTAIKHVESEIKKQLLEKEIILKESHHRIKNNFETIGGLLSLQADSLTNPETISVLKDAIGRVNSMQVLYEKLLLTDNYQITSVKEYMDDIIEEIISLYSKNIKITIKKQIDDFQLDSKRLVPVGIIVNELLTNVFKYSFSDRDSGLIEFTLKESEGEIILTMEDNGNGLPLGFNLDEQKGFGLMLIRMLSEQLDGSLTIDNHIGTRSIIKFPI